MKQLTIGIQITEEGLEFFGIDEVNELLKEGYRVISLEEGEALLETIEMEDDEAVDDDEEEIFLLTGCEININLEK